MRLYNQYSSYLLFCVELKVELEEEKQEYEDLTAKYEILEEEHVVTKAQLVAEKETLNRYVIAPLLDPHLNQNFFLGNYKKQN